MSRWSVSFMLDPRTKESFDFPSSTAGRKGRCRWVNYNGGTHASVSGPAININGELGLIDRSGQIDLAELPIAVLMRIRNETEQLSTAVHRSTSTLDLALLEQMKAKKP